MIYFILCLYIVFQGREKQKYSFPYIIFFQISRPFAFLDLKGIVNRAEPCKCDIFLFSRIIWHKRITLSSKEWRFWYIWHSSATFCHNFSLQIYTSPFQWRLLIFIRKNLWRRVLEANKRKVPLKNYSLKTRIDSVNQILKNKEKVT